MPWSTSARHGTNWKPPGYQALRRQVFARHGNRCIDCGATGPLELDHDNGNRGDWQETNLLPRCPPCHQKRTHAQAKAARARNKRARQRPQPPHPGIRH